MIIVKLSGGLGNQLFQYAVGRHLAHLHGTTLKFDVSGFQDGGKRQYALGHFRMTAEFASQEEVHALTEYRPGAVKRVVDRFLPRSSRRAGTHVCEGKSFRFNPRILTLPDNLYMDGYWQNEKYFRDVPDIIRQEVAVKDPLAGRNRDLAEVIASVNSVSLHIRRGDYVSDPKTRQSHGNCSLDYYMHCVQELAGAVDQPHYFVFSDEPQWACANLELDAPVTIVDHNSTIQAYEDLRLMRHCRHHIIANSSFSWWGAWLNPRPDKTVYAPKKWFAHDKWDFQDVVPSGWLRR
jgi:hypothetical protein